MAYESVNHPVRNRRVCAPLGLLLVVGLALAPGAAAQRGPGYVSSQSFIDIAGDDGVNVQVSIPPSLIKMVVGGDPELKRLLGGLESVEAVILDLDRRGVADRARTALKETESRLLKRGWERLVLVREDETDLRVLILNDETAVQGLVVMIVDSDEGQMVFANIAGAIDLSALEEIGDTFGVPHLGDIDLEDTN
jgi:hypothetical protein